MKTYCLNEQQVVQLVFGYYVLFKTVTELKKQFYVSHATVYRYLEKNAARFGYPKPTGFHLVKAKQIREEYSLGATPKELIERYGINKRTLYGYIYDKRYGGKPERVVQA